MTTLRHDDWLDREVLVLPIDDDSLNRARAFARVAHPMLPTVLRVDRVAQQIWIAPPLGVALADAPRKVPRDVFERFVQAIKALVAAGGAHGYVDLQHVYWYAGELQLAWPRKPTMRETPANDLRDVEKLGLLVVEENVTDEEKRHPTLVFRSFRLFSLANFWRVAFFSTTTPRAYQETWSPIRRKR